MYKKLYIDIELKMNKTLEHLSHELSIVRTGRASSNLLDSVKIDYYGSIVPKIGLIYNSNLGFENTSLLTIFIILIKRVPYIFNIIFSLKGKLCNYLISSIVNFRFDKINICCNSLRV